MIEKEKILEELKKAVTKGIDEFYKGLKIKDNGWQTFDLEGLSKLELKQVKDALKIVNQPDSLKSSALLMQYYNRTLKEVKEE
mmetsp:Transcript_9920/g.9809  ORF Transcript_9920/g.9809 Transcript_9920/m.9809 type:complete len:83 (+) Transcript_9920:1010-1258(+)